MRAGRPAIALSLLMVMVNWASAQFPVFENNDRVCFIGNSITMDGTFYHFIELFYATRFPEKKIRFYNCGISGDVAGRVIERLETDVLIHKPTWFVLMIGMNDVNRSLYGAETRSIPGIEIKRQEALQRYFVNVDSLIRILIRSGGRVALQTPSIYDQTAAIPAENRAGVNDALAICAAYIKKMGRKYKLPVVDYWSALASINKGLQRKDPSATIIGADRIHPGAYGHFIMTHTFLKTQRLSENISLISIKRKTPGYERNNSVIIDSVASAGDGIRFSALEQALPFPHLNDIPDADSLVPFTNNFNRETLRISSLKKGSYRLTVDSIFLGVFTDKALLEGINLSGYPHAPQYRQSLKVYSLLSAAWDCESDLRSVKYFEYEHLKGIKDLNDSVLVRAYFESDLKRKEGQPAAYINYYWKSYEKYMQTKPLERSVEDRMARLYEEVAESAQPVRHFYQITPAHR